MQDPALLVSKEKIGDVVFSGTMYVDSDEATGEDMCIGLVFGYQNTKKFYVVQWWKTFRQKEDDEEWISNLGGLVIKTVLASTNDDKFNSALWYLGGYNDYTTRVWQDLDLKPWEYKTPYRWKLVHRPSIGKFRLQVFTVDGLFVDSGDIYHIQYSGGRVGVFSYGQSGCLWSNMQYDCLGRLNQALELDGQNSYIHVGDVESLEITGHFYIEMWCRVVPVSRDEIFPILSASDGSMALYIKNWTLFADYLDASISLRGVWNGSWTHVAIRAYIGYDLTILINGKESAKAPLIIHNEWTLNTHLYLGKGAGGELFRGMIDELKIYRYPFADATNLETLFTEYNFYSKSGYIVLYYSMDEELNGKCSCQVFFYKGVIGSVTFAPSVVDGRRFKHSYPRNKKRRRKRSIDDHVNEDMHDEL
ncbi:uncharacterized protein LOC105444601 [Strongylocentrotus purpuratus]|uniref:TSP C-terminal domain-containing protein n=1 Tax=Strongylocentrotus purpuratus TaxID=7668 RepID=A0A7M7PFW4_STRPU|nr:uncharacterized protein LOC105444601 [Strongylocentrotus purpuratus]